MASNRLNKYIEADRKAKEAEAEKKVERAYVEKLLKRCSRLGVSITGVSYYESERFDFNQELLYSWLSRVVSQEDLEFATKKTVDLEKLEKLVLDGVVDTTTMPEECYTSKKSPTIKINHKELR